MSEAKDGIERRYHPTDGTRTKFGARLKDEGRLDAFNARVAELKSAGPKNKAARQEAFWQGVHEFAPPPPAPAQPADETETEPSPRPSPATVHAAAFASRDAVPSVRAISWVAANLAVDGVGQGDAPDSASWSLRAWVLSDKLNEKEFWKSLFPMCVRAERDVSPQWSPPDPEEHRKALEQINEVFDDVHGRHAAGMARRFVENPDMWELVKPVVEDALNKNRAHAAAVDSIITTIPRARRSTDEDEFLTAAEEWVGEEPGRRWRLLRDHLRTLVLTGRPGRARSAPAESAETQLQSTEL